MAPCADVAYAPVVIGKPDDEAPQGDGRGRAWLFGTAALAAWFAMLWFMFGDVL